MQKKRIEWLDIAKAISIVLVVLGHAGHAYLDIYLGWFRIPFFFFLSGILFKDILKSDFFRWAIVKIRLLLTPYFLYGGLIFLIFYLLGLSDITNILDHLLSLAYGGSRLQGAYGVFWFITVLIIVQLTLGYLSRFTKATQITIVIILFIIGHSPTLQSFDWIWNFNVALIALLYYSLGYFLKDYVIKYSRSFVIALISVLLATTFILLNIYGFIEFYYNMKMSRFNNLLLDIIIPISFFMPFIYVSTLIERFSIKTVFKFIGRFSIVIMYLHLPVSIMIVHVLGHTLNSFEFTLYGVLIPVIIGYLLTLTKPTRLLLGQSK